MAEAARFRDGSPGRPTGFLVQAGEESKKMLVVGLTGGVASGKSAVSDVLREEGAYVIDADQIAREVVQPHSPGWKQLTECFGDEILGEDGAIHRKKLAGKVFSDPEQRKRLERILHPRIRAEIERRVKEIARSNSGAVVVIDAALIVEREEYREMDKLIVVVSTEELQIRRLKEREGATREEAMKILAAQVPSEERLKAADYVILNEGSLEEMRRRAREVYKELERLALEKNRR